MNKKNIWILVIVLVIVVSGIYGILAMKSPKPTTTTTNTTPATSGIIQTKSTSSIGQYLANASGNALYTYGADMSGVSNCSGSCLVNWPAYQVTSSTTSLPANVTVIKRSDGTSQYAYKGMPLYTFISDSSGQVTGDGVANFHVAKP